LPTHVPHPRTTFYRIGTENFPVKKRTLTFNHDAVSDSRQCLPDFSADWQLPGPKASNKEVEARFYYEFARESQTILALTDRLCHFSRRELMRAQYRTLSYPGSPLNDLHFHCLTIARALMPRINLRQVSWSQLEPEQRQSVINEFSQRPAFRRLNYVELINFADYAMRAYCEINPTEANYTRLLADSDAKPPEDIGPWWYLSSRLSWDGVEQIAIRIDWNQGPQAIKRAMQQWFLRHKRGLSRLKSEKKLPGGKHGSYMFHLRDDTGAKNPRRKYITALRGLGAMRVLGGHTLNHAIQITRGELFSASRDRNTQQPTGRIAWNRGVERARHTFQEMFYPQDENSLRIRRYRGLPDIEEPISYQRYSRHRENK
jgi:hypothetical protein